MRQVSVFEGGYVVVSRKDGWEIDVERGVQPEVAQDIANALGIGIDYITVEGLMDAWDRAKVEWRREISERAEAKRRADRNAALAALAGDGWRR